MSADQFFHRVKKDNMDFKFGLENNFPTSNRFHLQFCRSKETEGNLSLFKEEGKNRTDKRKGRRLEKNFPAFHLKSH